MIKTVGFVALILLTVSRPPALPGGAGGPSESIQSEIEELRTLAVPVRSIKLSDEDFRTLDEAGKKAAKRAA